MRPPRMIGNTGERGEFVLPLKNPNADSDAQMDDFLNDAVAWTLTVHEARPGHEMQFAKMVENGVSQARTLYAFNSANVEGWALYMEAMLLPYLPLDGQLMSLQMRSITILTSSWRTSTTRSLLAASWASWPASITGCPR